MSFANLEAAGAPRLEWVEITAGAQVFRYTSADEPIAYDGHTFELSEVRIGALEQSGEASDGTLELRLPNTDPVARLFVGQRPAAPVTITLYRGHRGDANVATPFVGVVLSSDFEGAEAVLSCGGIERLLEFQCPSLSYQKLCPHLVYDAGCQLDPEDYRVAAVVTAVTGLVIEAAEFDVFDDGYFATGFIADAAGHLRFITGHVGAALTLNDPLPGLEPGDPVSACPGCQRDRVTCRVKFDNLDNFWGCPFIPLRDPYARGI